MAGPRSDPRYTRARAAVLADAKRLGLPCVCCGEPIDYDLKWDSKNASPYPSVNHRIPLAHGGDPFDPENMEPAHYGCNSRLSTGVKNTAAPSRTW